MKVIKELILEIVNYMNINSELGPEKKIISKLKDVSLSAKNDIFRQNIPFPKMEALRLALDSIKESSLMPIKNCIIDSMSELNWKIDDGQFYDIKSGIGNSYLNGNMHTELIGPKTGNFKFGELRLGLFLLESDTFYPDHKHEAPELYLNLTTSTKWRFDGRDWNVLQPGSIVYNEPYRIHAIHVQKIPFLSVWCWPHKSSKQCIVVPRT